MADWEGLGTVIVNFDLVTARFGINGCGNY